MRCPLTLGRCCVSLGTSLGSFPRTPIAPSLCPMALCRTGGSAPRTAQGSRPDPPPTPRTGFSVSGTGRGEGEPVCGRPFMPLADLRPWPGTPSPRARYPLFWSQAPHLPDWTQGAQGLWRRPWTRSPEVGSGSGGVRARSVWGVGLGLVQRRALGRSGRVSWTSTGADPSRRPAASSAAQAPAPGLSAGPGCPQLLGHVPR